MKRIFVFILAFVLLCGSALASAGYNSFFDNRHNAGYYDFKAWDGEYVYWLDNQDERAWTDLPNNLYRMRPGEGQAEMILEGREDLHILNFWNIGDALLLAVHDSIYSEEAKPVLIDFDGGNYREIDGRIGSVVLAGDVLYNSVGGHIYEIDLDTMKSKKIYSYPEEIAAKDPILYQLADDMLYFSTDAIPNFYEIYSLYRYPDADTQIRKVYEGRGSWFVYRGWLYASDYENNSGTWCYNILGGGSFAKLSDKVYSFYQGYGQYLRALPMVKEGWVEDTEGVIIDMTKVQGSLDDAIVRNCDHYYDAMLGGQLIRYDGQNNRMVAAE